MILQTPINHFEQDILYRWIMLQQSRHRLYGFQRTIYRNTTGSAKAKLKHQALEHMEERFTNIFQRRHDCIHNVTGQKLRYKGETLALHI